MHIPLLPSFTIAGFQAAVDFLVFFLIAAIALAVRMMPLAPPWFKHGTGLIAAFGVLGCVVVLLRGLA